MPKVTLSKNRQCIIPKIKKKTFIKGKENTADEGSEIAKGLMIVSGSWL